MTTRTLSREIRLASRPTGMPTADNFIVAETTLPPLPAQQVLVRNRFISVDPNMRGRMNEGESYVPAFAIGRALEGGPIGGAVAKRKESGKEFAAWESVARGADFPRSGR
jgi:NADPH-dependent curcumin reductase CurA